MDRKTTDIEPEPFPVFLVLAMAIACSSLASAANPNASGFSGLVVMSVREFPSSLAFMGVAFAAGMVAGFAFLPHRSWTRWLRIPALGIASLFAMACLIFIFQLVTTTDMSGGSYGVGGLIVDAMGWLMMAAIPGGLSLLIFIPAVRRPRII